MPIYAISPNEEAVRRMQLYWGVRPFLGNQEETTSSIIANSMILIRKKKLIKRGQLAVFTAGDPATNFVTGEGTITNMMHIVEAK